MKSILKKILPASSRLLVRRIQKAVVYRWRAWRINIAVLRNRPIKIILGAALTYQDGWYSTNEQWLDICSATDWQRVFRGKKLVSNSVAEHVFEHLTREQALNALKYLAKHMTAGGVVRIAVPDGYNPDPEYIRHVGIAGIGADAADHKQLLNRDALFALLLEAGFSPTLREGFLQDGTLIVDDVDPRYGKITRSRTNRQNTLNRENWDFPDSETSLIVDGVLK